MSAFFQGCSACWLPIGSHTLNKAQARSFPDPSVGVGGRRVLAGQVQVRVDGRTRRVDNKIMGEPILSPLRRAWEDFRSWLDL